MISPYILATWFTSDFSHHQSSSPNIIIIEYRHFQQRRCERNHTRMNIYWVWICIQLWRKMLWNHSIRPNDQGRLRRNRIGRSCSRLFFPFLFLLIKKFWIIFWKLSTVAPQHSCLFIFFYCYFISFYLALPHILGFDNTSEVLLWELLTYSSWVVQIY